MNQKMIIAAQKVASAARAFETAEENLLNSIKDLQSLEMGESRSRVEVTTFADIEKDAAAAMVELLEKTTPIDISMYRSFEDIPAGKRAAITRTATREGKNADRVNAKIKRIFATRNRAELSE